MNPSQQTIRAAAHRCLRFQAHRVYTYTSVAPRAVRRVGVVIPPLVKK